jgi:hypothetical protein
MSLPTNTFVIKERLESVEKKLDEILNDEDLHNLAKDIIKRSMSSYLTTARGEINEIIRGAQTSIEKEKKLATDMMSQEIESRISLIEGRMRKAEMISRIAVMSAFGSVVWIIITKFM